MKKLYLLTFFSIVGGSFLLSAANQANRSIGIDPEEGSKTVIYTVGGTTNKGVYTIPTEAPFAATKISGSTYIQYDFDNSGGTFVSKETVYGTKKMGSSMFSSYYATKATAAGNGSDGPWSHTFFQYRDPTTYTNYTYKIVTSDMAYDAVGKKIYGWFNADLNGTSWQLGEYNGDAISVTPIGDKSTVQISAIAADENGQLYGIEGKSGVLYRINKETGELTKQADLGVTADGANQSAAIDFATGKMFWAATTSSSASLYAIDLAKNTASKIYDFPEGERYNAFFIPAPEAKASAPAAVENLKGAFTGEGTNVTVSFTAPSKTAGESDLSGELDYTIQIDGTAVENGKINAGATYSKNFTLTEGIHSLTVFVANSEGNGPKSTAQIYAGFDKPGNISNLALKADGNSIALSWNAPQGVNGGTIDASKLSYTITRNSEEATVVSSGKTETTFTDIIPDGPAAEYYYTVTVVYDGANGESLNSESVLVGSPYSIPYKQDFETAASLGSIAYKTTGADTWAVETVDDNKLIKTGKRNSILFTAPIQFNGDTEYTLKFKIANSSTFDNVRMSIFLSKSQTDNSDDFISPFIENSFSYSATADTKDKLVEQTMLFSVAEAGVYSIGFRDLGYGYQDYVVSLDDIDIEDQNTSGVGNATSNNVAVSTARGLLNINNAENQRITIYGLDGRLVADSSAHGNHYSASLEKGVYIVTVNGNSFKVII